MTDKTPTFSWGHININVSNLERSIAFYQMLGFDIFIPAIPYLGLTMDQTPQPLHAGAAKALGLPAAEIDEIKGRACILGLVDSFPKLDLIELTKTNPSAPLTNGDLGLVRICLSSKDLKADVAHLKAQGVTFLSNPTSTHADLADIAICQDPDGTLIELIQVHLERWPSRR